MISELDCFDHGVRYVGTVFTTTWSYSTPNCQQNCLGNWLKCAHFSYDTVTGTCLLFSSITANEISPTSISGPNLCSQYLGCMLD